MILIVEDELEIAELLRFHVEREGFASRTVQSGRLALQAVEVERPDLILLDLMLPDLDGLEVCRRLKYKAETRDIPVLVVSAKGDEADIVAGIELGADDYVTKPFSIRELLARAKAFLRRRSSPEETAFEIGDAQLDLASHKLTRHGEEVQLTTKEYRLLEYFVQRRNRALTRSDIIDNVWGRSIIVSARSVDRCIATLRAKIEPDLRRPRFIHTIRDVGYRFELAE